MHASKFHSSTPVAMESLVSHKEYDLHFADRTTSSEVSMIYLKLTEGSLRSIEQVVRALNCSRSPAPPPIRLEMGDSLSGTFTLPLVRGDDVIASNPDNSGASFSVSLAPQNTSVDLLHTLTTYPTHEERSHTPGTRRASIGAAPPEPEIFLNFLGPIGYRLGVRAVAGEAFDRTRSKFNEISETNKNYGARQLQRIPGPKRGMRPEFGRSRPFNRGTVPPRPPGPRFPPPPRPRLVPHNGLHSPSGDPAPTRVHARKMTSPPQHNHRLPGPSAAPMPPVPPAATSHLGKASPAKRRAPSPDSDSEGAEDPAPKRAKKEKRAGAEGLLSAGELAEIANFQKQDCKWADLFPDILSQEIRTQYRRTYDASLPAYKRLRERVESNIAKMSVYKARLARLDGPSPGHRRLKKKATRLCQQTDELRKLHSFLHDKLSVVKKQIELFDKSL